MVMGDVSADTEVVVLGGGPGGYAAAFRAADRGLETTLVTEERMGGVCLLRGCIPSKALLEATGLVERTRSGADMGIVFDHLGFDPDGLRTWKDGIVDELVAGLEDLAAARDVRVVRGRGRLESPNRLRVEGSDVAVVEFEHAIVATGSVPMSLPDVELGGPVWDSAAALELRRVPDRMLVVGGGYVGLELGSVYARLGSEVVLVEATDSLLPGVDPELVEPLAAAVGELFEEIRTGTPVERLTAEEGSVRVVTGEGGSEEVYDCALVAIGRRPRSDGLGLKEAGVELDDDGHVVVDERQRTSAEHIYAVGDVTAGSGLAHEAMHAGRVAADVIGGEPAAFDVRAVPAVVYTHPQIAWCGMEQGEAEERGIAAQTVRVPLRALGRAHTFGPASPEGLLKLVLDEESLRVLGAGIVGPQAEALVTEVALAVEMGATARDLELTIHPHPTLSEAVFEGAARGVGMPTHLTPGGRAG